MNIVYAAALAYWHGWLENYPSRHGGHNEYIMIDGLRFDEPKILGILKRYHIPLGLGWLFTCIVLGCWWFFPAFCVIQDYTWHYFDDTRLSPDEWVSAKLGGFFLFHDFWPWTYMIGLTISGILFYVNVLISK